MPKNPLQATKNNRLTKSQNPALALATVTEIQILVEILTPSLKVVEDMGAAAAKGNKEAGFLTVQQLVEQITPNLPTQVIIAKTPALTAIK